MHFAIFIPGDDVQNEQKLAAVGLSHLIPGAACVPVSNGPDGKRGVIFSWPDARGPVGYLPNNQRWVPAYEDGERAAGRYSVGFSNAEPPLPHELAWGTRYDGLFIQLGDGNEWCIPAAGLFPESIKYTSDGRQIRTVRKQFKSYFDDSVKWFVDFINRDFDQLTQEISPEAFPYVERALSLNYRLTREVISELDLIGTDNIFACIRATLSGLEIQTEQEAQKKSSSLVAG